jgi:hypothetical protein
MSHSGVSSDQALQRSGAHPDSRAKAQLGTDLVEAEVAEGPEGGRPVLLPRPLTRQDRGAPATRTGTADPYPRGALNGDPNTETA